MTLGPDLSQYTDTNQSDCSADPFNPSPAHLCKGRSSTHPWSTRARAAHLQSALNCKGVIELQSSSMSANAPTIEPGAATHRAQVRVRATTYATGSFNIPAHRSKTVTLKLSRVGERRVREQRRVGVWINVMLTGPTPKRLYTRATRLTF